MAIVVSSVGLHAAGSIPTWAVFLDDFLQDGKLSARPDDFGRTKNVGTMTDENISGPTANEKSGETILPLILGKDKD